MQKADAAGMKGNAGEQRFLDRRRQHPELRARFESLWELAHNPEGPLKTADQGEERLMQALRQWGNTSMNPWAVRAEPRGSAELKAQEVTVRSRKKNAGGVGCLWMGERAGSGRAPPEPELPATLARAMGRAFRWPVPAAGAGADGLWL